ncbi:uncharacterized protein LOC136768694 [Amia ocellicauda]|uniref:uncharacterized protein LOC136768694 n=1 Tax=Amia ocellicauda TaxID=2972642 RepID=UPI003463A742
MRREESDSNGQLYSSPDTSEQDCEGEGDGGAGGVETVCQLAIARLPGGKLRVCGRCQRPHCEPHEHSTCVKGEEGGRSRGLVTRFSEGYGTEEVLTEPECVQAVPQGESDADADIEDTDNRLQEAESLQRISSKRRRRQRITKQDTTESEDDGGRSHRVHRWNLRLSPHRTHSRTIEEESVSQVRPLVLGRPCSGGSVCPQPGPGASVGGKGAVMWPSSLLPWPLALSLLLLPLSILLLMALLPLVST